MSFPGNEPQPDFAGGHVLADMLYQGETPGGISPYVMTIAKNSSGRLSHAVQDMLRHAEELQYKADGRRIIALYDTFSSRTPTVSIADAMLVMPMLDIFDGNIDHLTAHRWSEGEAAAPAAWYDLVTEAQTGTITERETSEAELDSCEMWRQVFQAAFNSQRTSTDALNSMRGTVNDAFNIHDRVQPLAKRGRRRFTAASVALGAIAGVLLSRQNPDMGVQIAGGAAGAAGVGAAGYIAGSMNMRLQYLFARGGARRIVQNAENMRIIDSPDQDN